MAKVVRCYGGARRRSVPLGLNAVPCSLAASLGQLRSEYTVAKDEMSWEDVVDDDARALSGDEEELSPGRARYQAHSAEFQCQQHFFGFPRLVGTRLCFYSTEKSIARPVSGSAHNGF